jgi:uncharacterized protein
LLPSRIGSPLSVLSLAKDLQVSPNAVDHWIRIFESFYLVFTLKPWTQKISRAIKKERKLYLYDYADVQDRAAKFENMVALELLRAVSNWNDYGLGRFELHYIRNRAGEEVDFVISDNRTPIFLVETKLSEGTFSKTLLRFQDILHVPVVQLVQDIDICRLISNGNQQALLATASRWLPQLP